jgi:DNA-binding Lrp family transcriptional regulator
MKNLDRCYDAVLQSSTKGISAVEIAKKLGIHKTIVHRNLNTLELLGKVESQHGVWRAKKGEQTIKPLEKEIVIELPMPKNQWRQIGTMEASAKYLENLKLPRIAEDIRILLEKFNETRIIRIKGKNVDDLDLQKLGNLIQQANRKSSKVNLRGMFKSLKRSHPRALGEKS